MKGSLQNGRQVWAPAPDIPPPRLETSVLAHACYATRQERRTALSTFPMPLGPSDSLQTAPARGMLAVPRRNPHAYQIKQWELVLLQNSPESRLSGCPAFTRALWTLTRSPLFSWAQRLFLLAEWPPFTPVHVSQLECTPVPGNGEHRGLPAPRRHLIPRTIRTPPPRHRDERTWCSRPTTEPQRRLRQNRGLNRWFCAAATTAHCRTETFLVLTNTSCTIRSSATGHTVVATNDNGRPSAPGLVGGRYVLPLNDAGRRGEAGSARREHEPAGCRHRKLLRRIGARGATRRQGQLGRI